MIDDKIPRAINEATKGNQMYDSTRYPNTQGNNFNFLPAKEPFKLTQNQKEEMLNIGKEICNYMDACIDLYHKNEEVRILLDRGKPDRYKNVKEVKYLFLRPDLILTDEGFIICEIETSPFGLALAEVLNDAYGILEYNPIISQNQLKNYMQQQTNKDGIIAYSNKVQAFKGQLDFLANQVFGNNNRHWESKNISVQQDRLTSDKEIYRAFYLNDQYNDEMVAKILNENHLHIPSETPQFEEKALLVLIWDKRFVVFFKEQLGEAGFELLRKAIPKTWIIGQEQYVDGGLPNGYLKSKDIGQIGKSKRKYVLKESGFNNNSSWGKGVHFLHKCGGNNASKLIKEAEEDTEHLYIIQEFKQPETVEMTYIDNNYVYNQKQVKIRVTPYFSYSDNKGELIAAKVTGCDISSELIHAGTGSINAPIDNDYIK